MNEILEQDDLDSLEELRQILLKEQETPSFVGVFVSEPDCKEYPINTTYKRDGVVYINTESGWFKLVEDGLPGKDGYDGKTTVMGGGGLGYNDVVKTIKSTTIQSNYVDVGTGFINSTSRNLDGLLHDFDSIITSGGGGSFIGTIDSSAVNVPPNYINTSATTLDGVIRDFDLIISGQVLFGEYKTNDVFEEAYLYVGCAALDGRWYVKRVEEVGDEMYLRYANVSNNSTVMTYADAINSRASLIYDLIQNITV